MIKKISKKSSTNVILKLISLFILVLFVFPSFLLLTATNVHAQSNSYITFDKFSGYPGTSILVSGGGFLTNESLSIYTSDSLGNKVDGTSEIITTDKNGMFAPTNFYIPVNEAQGFLFISASDNKGNISTNSFYITPLTPSISLTYTQSRPQDIILVSGKGFAANENIAVNLASNSLTITSDAFGKFNNLSLQIPNIKPSTYQVNAIGLMSGAKANQYLYVGGYYPSSYPNLYYFLPGQVLNVSGSGYANNEEIDAIDNITNTILFKINADALGNFKNVGNYIIPISYVNSSKTINLFGKLSKVSSSITIGIGQYFPNISPSSYFVMPGQTLNFSGTGFYPLENVTVYDKSTSPKTELTSFKVDKLGSFKNLGQIAIPYKFANQSKNFDFVGDISNSNASVSITVGNLYPQISLSSYYAKPGQMFNVIAKGFVIGENVDLFLNGIKNITGLVDNYGNITFKNVVLPLNSVKSVTISVVGETSLAKAQSDLQVGTYNPSISSSSYYILPGQLVSFSGSDFGPNESVDVVNNLKKIETLQTDAAGALMQNSLLIPFGINGDYPLVFSGVKTGATAKITVTIASYVPSASSDNYYASAGSTVNISATGFAPNENVSIIVGNTSVFATADKKGNILPTPLVLPFGSLKSFHIFLEGQLSLSKTSLDISLRPYSSEVSPSTYYTTPGSTVTFNGSGFASGENISVSLNKTPIGTIKADMKGSLVAYKYNLPYGINMALFSFTGLQSNAISSSTIGIAGFYPGLQLSSYYDNGGKSITLSGSGYAPQEYVDITFGNSSLPKILTDAKGAFRLTTLVPYAVAGNKIIKGIGELSMASAMTTFTQALVYTSIQLQNYAGKPGSAITFIGSGYLPNEPVNVYIDKLGKDIIYTLTADKNGNIADSKYILPLTITEGNITFSLKSSYSFTSQDIIYYVQGV